MHRSGLGPAWALLVAVPLGLGAVPGPWSPAGQESQAVVRLQQEVSALEYRLDFETQQMRRSLEQLQSQLRAVDQRQRRAGGITAAAPLPAPTSVEVRDEVTARRFVVQDQQGRARSVATVSERFGPMLALLDTRGDVKLMLASPDDGPRVELFDDRLQLRLLLRVEGGEPFLELFDADGHSMARLELSDGEARLDLVGQDR